MQRKTAELFIPVEIALNSAISFGARVFYGHLFSLTDESGETAMTNAELASHLGVSESTVKRWLRELREVEYIKVMNILSLKKTSKRVIILTP